MFARAQSRVFDLTRPTLEESGTTGERRGLRRILASVRSLALTDAAVLIPEETGTGKELIARAIHHDLQSRCRAWGLNPGFAISQYSQAACDLPGFAGCLFDAN